MVRINGILKEAAGMTLLEYLLTTDYKISRIAVERNGDIVPKARYDTIILHDEDTVEIVSFVGGG